MRARERTRRRPYPILSMAAIAAIAAILVVAIAVRAGLWGRSGGGTTPRATATVDGPGIIAGPSVIAATRRSGTLAITLRVSPPVLGSARFAVEIRARETPVARTGLQIRLSMPAFPALGTARIALARTGAGWTGEGAFTALGRWRADVLVPGGANGAATSVPFDFLVGPNAGFLRLPAVRMRFGDAAVSFAPSSQASGTLRIHLRPGLRVRSVVTMPSMPEMGSATVALRGEPGGWYSGEIVFGMSGVASIAIEARELGGWQLVRRALFDLGSSNRAELIALSPIAR